MAPLLWSWFRQFVSDTLRFFGLNIRTGLVALLYPVGHFYSNWTSGDTIKMDWGVYLVLIFIGALFVKNLIMAPLSLERDNHQKRVEEVKQWAPLIQQVFTKLTDNGFIKTNWCPFGSQWQLLEPDKWEWKGVHNYNTYHQNEKEALHLFFKKGLIASITDDPDGATFTVSPRAESIRRSY